MWSIEQYRPRPPLATLPWQLGHLFGLHDSLENLRYFEYRTIADAGNASAKFVETMDYLGGPAAHRFERIEHDARLLLEHPIGVVAFLRHGPGVAYHDHRQALVDRLAEAAGTRLADEEIG